MLASFFGVGYLPKAPGTWGSLAALVVLIIPFHTLQWLLPILVVVVFAISLPIVSYLEKSHGHDPQFIVIDEVLGMWLVLCNPFFPKTYIFIIASFVFFRLFDIFKPYPISILQKKHGGFYILADDLLAGIMASIALQLVYWGYLVVSFMVIMLQNDFLLQK